MLVRTVDDENATLPQRMDAAKTILDRVYGKASQPIEGNGGAAVPVAYTHLDVYKRQAQSGLILRKSDRS